MSLLEQDTTIKEQIDKKVIELELEVGKSKKYKIKAIWNKFVYTNNTERDLSNSYYLVMWKNYTKKQNIWELFLII